MAFIPVPGVVQCNIRATLFDQQVENVLCFQGVEGAPIADTQAAADVVRDAWGEAVVPVLSGDYRFREVYAVNLTAEDGAAATAAGAAGGNPGQGNAALPGSVAVVITHRTIQRGRSFRGRTFIAGIPDSAVTGNTLEQSFATALLAGFTEFIANCTFNQLEFVIVSRFSGGQPRSQGLVTPVTASLLRDLTVDSQRRRLSGRGS